MTTTAAARPFRVTGLSSADAPALDLPARFMAVGMVALAALALMAPWTMPLLLNSFYDPRLLAFVHVNTLGVIGAIILGASYQLIPVVLQTPLTSVRLGRISFWCYLGGLIALPLGLLRTWTPALAVGGTLLLAAILLYAGVVFTTLRRAPHLDAIAWHVAMSVVGVLGGATYGVILALNKGSGFLGAHTLNNLAAHATIMLGGWVALLLMGVAYRLVGMFTLAEDALWIPGAWLGLALTAGGAWTVSTNMHLGGPRAFDLAGSIALLGGLICFAAQIVHLFRRRRRRIIDVHSPFVMTAAAAGVIAAALLVVGFARELGPNSPLWIAAGWLAIAGFAETAIQGFFYKISTFLVWLQRYAPLAGRQRVPKLEDLYWRRLAFVGWGIWTAGVALETVAVGLGVLALSRVAGVLVAAGLLCFLVNVGRIANHWRAPAKDSGAGSGNRGRLAPAGVPATPAPPRS